MCLGTVVYSSSARFCAVWHGTKASKQAMETRVWGRRLLVQPTASYESNECGRFLQDNFHLVDSKPAPRPRYGQRRFQVVFATPTPLPGLLTLVSPAGLAHSSCRLPEGSSLALFERSNISQLHCLTKIWTHCTSWSASGGLRNTSSSSSCVGSFLPMRCCLLRSASWW